MLIWTTTGKLFKIYVLSNNKNVELKTVVEELENHIYITTLSLNLSFLIFSLLIFLESATKSQTLSLLLIN